MKSLKFLQEKLDKRKVDGNYRRLFLSKSELIDFSSNDYLGLAKNSNQINLMGKHGSGGSRLLSGNSATAESLEYDLKSFHQSEAALLFNSGYTANLGFFSTIPQRGDIVLFDEKIHSSVKDGLRLGLAKYYSFEHNSHSALRAKLERFKSYRVFVAVEAVYSMDGDVSPLNDIVDLCEEFGAFLMVDEAHSVGVFGQKGEGLVQSLRLFERIPFRLITFGKALGAHGAVILASQVAKDYLVNFSRPFIYSTALPEVSLKVIAIHYQEMARGARVKKLRSIIEYYQSKFKNSNPSAIQTISISGNENVQFLSDALRDSGLDIRAVKSPTVQEGKERLRVCLHEYNTKEQLDVLFGFLLSEYVEP